MDKQHLAEKLGVPSGGTFQIMDMRLVGWGTDVIFAGFGLTVLYGELTLFKPA